PAEPEEVCEGVSQAKLFRTYLAPSVGAPDNRVFELVSPAQKNGGQVVPAFPAISSCGSEVKCKPGINGEHFPMQTTPDGNAIVYQGTSFARGSGAAAENEYIARRTAAGWQTINLTPALMVAERTRGYRGFDEKLSTGILGQLVPPLAPGAPAG